MSTRHSAGSTQGSPRRHAERSHYRELLWHTLLRQFLLYFLPLLLLAVFFNVQYGRLVSQSTRVHLKVIAEHQASTLDLFLRERLVNLANLIDDPANRDLFGSETFLQEALERLRQTSDAFLDLGWVDEQGRLLAYYGPVDYEADISYASEAWFRQLTEGEQDWLITDIYLGFRGQPHFTIAVERRFHGANRILRSTLSPAEINEYLATLEGANEVLAAVVNSEGLFQVVTPQVGSPLQEFPARPPHEPRRGYFEESSQGETVEYGYAWLEETPWVLVVRAAEHAGTPAAFVGMPSHVLWVTLALFLVMGVVIVVRARQLAGREIEVEQQRAELSGQLVQAAKLASVGQLAAGVAHEINNPLAVIAEEVGLIKDSMDPELSDDDEEELDLMEHLDAIHDAVFRCRDITRQLLTFVRRSEVKLEPHDPHAILDDVLEGIMGHKLAISNIALVKDYGDDGAEIVTDRNRLVQVFVGVVENAIAAMPEGGTLTVRTRHKDGQLVVRITDTGCGMTPEQLEMIFVPFYTTKEPGKGTGLGLSVGSSIVESLGGRIYAESSVGKGSTFTIELPCNGSG